MPLFRFPFTEYPSYTSGSVVLGNMFLEIMRFGRPQAKASFAVPAARYFILGFLSRPNTLRDSVRALDRRGIPHSGTVPFFAREATDDNPVAMWENVYLGELLGHNLWMRVLFAMLKQTDPKPSLQRSRLMNAVSVFLLRRAFAAGMPVLTEYLQQTDAHAQAVDGTAVEK